MKTKTDKTRNPQWFASGGGIARTGPFTTQFAAYKAMTLTEDAQARQRLEHGTCSPYPHDLAVWPEGV
jgi:hypothetical protein